MKRRPLQEINAGSMADIAFLLLIFWLVTTTIDTDEGIKRQLPPWEENTAEHQVPVHDRDVFEVRVNKLDELLVEREVVAIEDLCRLTREFLIANGDGVINSFQPEKIGFPRRKLISIEDANFALESAMMTLTVNQDVEKEGQLKKIIEKWEGIILALGYIKRPYAKLPGAAHISVSSDDATTYDTYIQVQNELERAINELRDELAMNLFGESYATMEETYGRHPEDLETLNRIYAIRAVYPYIISEAIETE